jgi:hypothetical protein
MDKPKGMPEHPPEGAWALVTIELNRRRQHGIYGKGQYRPHFIFGDADENGFIYYGVMVWLFDDKLEPGESGRAFVRFIFQEGVVPPPCKPDAFFEVREGYNIVGTGRIQEAGTGTPPFFT